MENILKKISLIEEKVLTNIDLLEISKQYCQFNYDKSCEVSTLISILEIILNNQRTLMDNLEEIFEGKDGATESLI